MRGFYYAIGLECINKEVTKMQRGQRNFGKCKKKLKYIGIYKAERWGEVRMNQKMWLMKRFQSERKLMLKEIK